MQKIHWKDFPTSLKVFSENAKFFQEVIQSTLEKVKKKFVGAYCIRPWVIKTPLSLRERARVRGLEALT